MRIIGTRLAFGNFGISQTQFEAAERTAGGGWKPASTKKGSGSQGYVRTSPSLTWRPLDSRSEDLEDRPIIAPSQASPCRGTLHLCQASVGSMRSPVTKCPVLTGLARLELSSS